MPPGHAKSVYCSWVFPAWWFARHPRSSVIAVSYNSEMAEKFGRRVRNLVDREKDTLGYTLREDSKAAGRWETSAGGEYMAVGIGGGITGNRADLIIIDDPVKGREMAKNEDQRNKIWDYYRSDLYTRLKPGGRIIVIMTRWDVDDLGGRLLDEMGSGGDDWKVLKLAALAEDPALSTEEDPIEPDPLRRKPGEALWPEWENEEALHRKRLNVGENDWASLFQQRPKPPKGALFDVDKIQIVPSRPEKHRSIIRSWDLAATAQIGSNDPDWTVGLLLVRTQDDRYVVADVKRFRGNPNEVIDTIVATAEADGQAVPIRLPEDPGQAGKSQSAFLASRLAGHRVTFERETGAKETRAMPVVSQAAVGNLSIVQAQWNRAFQSELRDFPNGRKDDMVDALSGAFNVIGVKMPPMQLSPEALQAVMAMKRRM